MTRQRSLFAVWLAGLIACLTTSVVLAQSAPDIPAERVSKTEHYTLRAVSLVKGLYHPWSIAFLPGGRMIVTERRGTMRIVEGGKLIDKPIEGLPMVAEHGQGGLLDVVLHPKTPRTAGSIGATTQASRANTVPSSRAASWLARANRQ